MNATTSLLNVTRLANGVYEWQGGQDRYVIRRHRSSTGHTVTYWTGTKDGDRNPTVEGPRMRDCVAKLEEMAKRDRIRARIASTWVY